MLKQKIKLMTDSVSDISKDRAEALGIHMLYMPITIEGKALREELDFTKEEFYEMIDRAQEYPSTAQLTPFEIMEAYEQIAAEGYTDLIYMTIGSGGSGTYNNAYQMREQYYAEHPQSQLKIHLVDGRNYTATYGYAVVEAAKMLARGASVPEIVDYLEDATRLQYTAAGDCVYNPNAQSIWIRVDLPGQELKVHEIPGGQLVKLF